MWIVEIIPNNLVSPATAAPSRRIRFGSSESNHDSGSSSRGGLSVALSGAAEARAERPPAPRRTDRQRRDAEKTLFGRIYCSRSSVRPFFPQ